jgi:hypothetical protein
MIEKDSQDDQAVTAKCPKCGRLIQISMEDWEKQQ